MGEDKDRLEEQLELAQKHVEKAKRHCVRQREIVEELERDGHHELAARARDFLRSFEEFHAQFVAERERLKAELAK
jgi:hypothetical protein